MPRLNPAPIPCRILASHNADIVGLIIMTRVAIIAKDKATINVPLRPARSEIPPKKNMVGNNPNT